MPEILSLNDLPRTNVAEIAMGLDRAGVAVAPTSTATAVPGSTTDWINTGQFEAIQVLVRYVGTVTSATIRMYVLEDAEWYRAIDDTLEPSKGNEIRPPYVVSQHTKVAFQVTTVSGGGTVDVRVMGGVVMPVKTGRIGLRVGGSESAGTQKPRGNVLIPFGDSLSIGGGLIQNGTIVHSPLAYAMHLYLISGGRIRIPVNAGVSGNTTAQMLARVQADVIAHRPDFCLVLGGTNDLNGTVPVATIFSNLVSCWEALRDAGIVPIAATVYPKTDDFADIAALNARIRHKAAQMKIRVVDLYPIHIDPATGTLLAGTHTDGVHLTEAANATVAARIWDQIADLFPLPGDAILAGAKTASGPGQLITNGLFIGDANADGLADGWEASGIAGTWALTLPAGTGSVKGNWQQFDVTAAGQRTYRQAITAGWAVGDVLEFSGRFRLTANTGMNVSIRIDTQTTGAFFAHAVYQMATIGEYVFRCRGTVPAGATAVRPLIINSAAGTGTFAMAQCNLANLTQLGVA